MANETNAVDATVSEVPADSPVPAEVARPTAERSDEELAHEIHEFGKQFPEPEMGTNLADARWFEENWRELVRLYSGQIVVVFNGAVVAHGGNALQLQLDVARRLNVHPDRLTVELIYAGPVY